METSCLFLTEEKIVDLFTEFSCIDSTDVHLNMHRPFAMYPIKRIQELQVLSDACVCINEIRCPNLSCSGLIKLSPLPSALEDQISRKQSCGMRNDSDMLRRH
jgi:hypothetical protein